CTLVFPLSIETYCDKKLFLFKESKLASILFQYFAVSSSEITFTHAFFSTWNLAIFLPLLFKVSNILLAISSLFLCNTIIYTLSVILSIIIAKPLASILFSLTY